MTDVNTLTMLRKKASAFFLRERGFAPHDIAAQLDLPVDTVREWLHVQRPGRKGDGTCPTCGTKTTHRLRRR